MYGELNNQEIDEVLHGETLGRIGYESDGKIFIVPIAYAYDGNNVYVYSADGHKVHAMHKNPQVAFEVEEVKGLSEWRSVHAHGRFEILRSEEADHAHGLLSKRISTALADERPGAAVDLFLGSAMPPAVGDQSGESLVNGQVYRIALYDRVGRFEKK